MTILNIIKRKTENSKELPFKRKQRPFYPGIYLRLEWPHFEPVLCTNNVEQLSVGPILISPLKPKFKAPFQCILAFLWYFICLWVISWLSWWATVLAKDSRDTNTCLLVESLVIVLLIHLSSRPPLADSNTINTTSLAPTVVNWKPGSSHTVAKGCLCASRGELRVRPGCCSRNLVELLTAPTLIYVTLSCLSTSEIWLITQANDHLSKALSLAISLRDILLLCLVDAPTAMYLCVFVCVKWTLWVCFGVGNTPLLVHFLCMAGLSILPTA